MAASDVEDGEIVGEVNENYQRCSPRERHAAKREAEPASAAGAQQQQLPGWEDEQQPAGTAKRKPKKEKKKKKQKDLAGQSSAAGNGNIAAAAGDAVGSQGQETTYVNVYGSNVSAADLHHTP
jgi:Fe-S oxidoreductase